MRRADKEKHEILLEFVQYRRVQIDGLNECATVRMERDEVQASKSRGVFILFSDVFSKEVACDVEGTFCKLIFGDRLMQVCTESFEDVDTNAGGRAKTCAWRNF